MISVSECTACKEPVNIYVWRLPSTGNSRRLYELFRSYCTVELLQKVAYYFLNLYPLVRRNFLIFINMLIHYCDCVREIIIINFGHFKFDYMSLMTCSLFARIHLHVVQSAFPACLNLLTVLFCCT